MDDPNTYAPRNMANADVIDKAFTMALEDALEIEDFSLGLKCLHAQASYYDLTGSDAESMLVSDFVAGYAGMESIREMEKKEQQ